MSTLNQSPSRPQSESQIAQMFDRVAGRYDFLNALLSLRQDKRWRRQMISRIPHREEGWLLDVATGTGDVLIAARTQHREFAHMTGVDISAEMLHLAKLKSQVFNGQGPKVEFQIMSACDLTFSAQTFDCITIAFGLRNVVDKEKALSEFYRLLRPQGKLLILEFFNPETTVFARLFQWYFHQILPMIGGLFSDKEAYHYLPRSVGNFYSARELEGKLVQTGFSEVSWKSFIFGSCRLLEATKV